MGRFLVLVHVIFGFKLIVQFYVLLHSCWDIVSLSIFCLSEAIHRQISNPTLCLTTSKNSKDTRPKILNSLIDHVRRTGQISPRQRLHLCRRLNSGSLISSPKNITRRPFAGQRLKSMGVSTASRSKMMSKLRRRVLRRMKCLHQRDKESRKFICGCPGKPGYLSHPALHTHTKQHNGVA